MRQVTFHVKSTFCMGIPENHEHPHGDSWGGLGIPPWPLRILAGGATRRPGVRRRGTKNHPIVYYYIPTSIFSASIKSRTTSKSVPDRFAIFLGHLRSPIFPKKTAVRVSIFQGGWVTGSEVDPCYEQRLPGSRTLGRPVINERATSMLEPRSLTRECMHFLVFFNHPIVYH